MLSFVPFVAVGRQSPSWHTMECCLFLLDIHLDLECSRWTPFEGVLRMVPEPMPVMAQESRVKQSWHLQSIRASIWLLWSRGSTGHDGVLTTFPPFHYILVGRVFFLTFLLLSNWFWHFTIAL